MKREIPVWQMGGFILTAVAGTLLHFSFDWTGGNVAAALFSAVNESIWEHLKLLFYPMALVALMEYFFWGRKKDGFWCVKLVGVLIGLALIVVVYYTYTGALGVKADWFNITLFFLAAGAAYWMETKLLQRGFSCRLCSGLAFGLLCLISVAFTVLTFAPPSVPLFQDPLSGSFGYQG